MTDDPIAGLEPRILPLRTDEMSPDGLELATRLRANFGLTTDDLPDSIATMLRHPELYRAHVDFVTAKLKAQVVAGRDIELVILRTAWLCRSGYVWGEHVTFGKKAGLTSEEIERVTIGSGDPDWSERDRALMRLAEELHETSFVTDATWDTIAANLNDKEIIELLIAAGTYHEVAYLYNAMRVRKIPGNEGLSAR